MATVLIVGASGMVGSAALERFLRDDEGDVVAVSRRKPEIDAARRYRHVPVDLHDAAAARRRWLGWATSRTSCSALLATLAERRVLPPVRVETTA
jgi:nucleoside-diphosphate-sugar epimerase